jgi:adenylate cyclase
MTHEVRPQVRVVLASLGLLITLLACMLELRPPGALRNLDYSVYDVLLRATHSSRVSNRVGIVDVDEASLKIFGQWPWPRNRLALLLQKIEALGASSVAFDIILAEADRTSPGSLRQVDIAPGGFAGALPDNDRILAEALGALPIVTSYQFQFEPTRGPSQECPIHALSAGYLSRTEPDRFPQLTAATGVTCNLVPLAGAARFSGFLNVAPDSDGIHRRVPLVIPYRGSLYPSLALATTLHALNVQQVLLELESAGLTALRVGERRIPVDTAGNLLVHYRGGRDTFEYFSAGEILQDKLPRTRLAGRIVVLGTSAAGLKDTRPTPLDPLEPGPEIHATVIDNILTGDFISNPPWTKLLELFLILFLGGSFTLFLSLRSSLIGLPALLIVCVAGLLLGSASLLSNRGVFASPLLPLLCIGGVVIPLTSLRYWDAEREIRLRTDKLMRTQDAIIQSMTALAETRHSETGGHIQRTRHYVRILAQKLKDHPRFRDALDDNTIDLLFRLAPLHDIGKVGVRDHILLKPGPLSADEYEEMKNHTALGAEAILRAERMLGDDSFLRLAGELALTHQERWDGTGYPKGLAGDDIPLSGRLMAVADVYDAITHVRVYQAAVPHEAAVEIMKQGRGTHFDPDILDAFLDLQDEFRSIALKFQAEDE